MRTTLTLEEDLVARLKDLAHRKGTTFKEAVNTAIRRGLTAPSPSAGKAKQFRVRTFRSGFRPGVDPLRLNQLADDIEVRRFGSGT